MHKIRVRFPVPRDQAALAIALALGGATNYAYGVALAWLLKPADYGIIAFVQALVVILAFPLAYGIPASLVIQGGIASRNFVRRAFFGALVTNVAIGLLLSAVVIAAFAAGPLRPGFQTIGIATWAALSFPFIAFIAICMAVGQAELRFMIVGGILTCEIVVKGVAGLSLVALGWGPLGATVGLVIGSVGGSVVASLLLYRRLGFRPARVLELPRRGLAVALFLAQFGGILLFTVDLVAVKLLVADSSVSGRYQAALLLSNVTYYLVIGAIEPVIVAKAARRESLEAATTLLSNAVRFVATVLIPVQVALAAAPDVFLRLVFPSSYEAAAPLLRVLALANVPLLIVAVLAALFRGLALPSIPAKAVLPCVALEIVVLAFVVPRGGAKAAAFVFLGACILAAASLIVALIRSEVGRQLVRRPSNARWLLKWTLSGAVGIAAGILVGGFGAGGGGIVALGLLAYCSVGVLTGVFTEPRRPLRVDKA